MKNVLIIDASKRFGEFLADKLEEEKINVVFVPAKKDALTRMVSVLPELVIWDLNEYDNFNIFLELLQDIKKDPNALRIPMIAAGPIMDKKNITVLAKFGISKYFVKPIKFDVFFESIGHILHTAFSMDITPCVLDIHRNSNIIFIEIAQGLNREKISLLKYKLFDVIEANELEHPKIILMMTNLDLTFVDGLNLELLLDNILANPKIMAKNVKVLSFSSFTKDLIDGHPQYSGIEVATDISQVLNSLVESTTTSRVSDLITDKILYNSGNSEESSIEMRFAADTAHDKKNNQKNDKSAAGGNQNGTNPSQNQEKPQEKAKPLVAVVDASADVLNALSAALPKYGLAGKTYSNTADFIQDFQKQPFRAVIIDILMPGVSGFEILRRMQTIPSCPPVIVYSQAVRREIVMQALALGAKQYLAKPQSPEIAAQKVAQILNSKN